MNNETKEIIRTKRKKWNKKLRKNEIKFAWELAITLR